MHTEPRVRQPGARAALLVGFVLLTALLALPALLLGALLWVWARRAPGRWRWLAVVGLAVAGAAGLVVGRAAFGTSLGAATSVLAWFARLWVGTLLATPIVALGIQAVRPRSVQEQLHAHARAQTRRDQRQTRAAPQRAVRAPDAVGGQLVFGAAVGGSDQVKAWERGRWVTYPA